MLALRRARNAQRAAAAPPKPRPEPAPRQAKPRPSRALPAARMALPAPPPAALPPEEVDARLAQRADQVRAALREATKTRREPDILRLATQFRMPPREIERLRRETLHERHAA
jgi:hypothetical protein